MKKLSFLVAAAFIMPAAIFSQNNGSVTLAKGQKYVVENKVSTTSNSEMQGQSMETTADVTSVYNIAVDNIQNDNYNMINKIAAIKLTMSSMGNNINFDSDKKEDMAGDMGSNLKDIINAPNPVVMDKSGNIIVSKTDTSTQKAAASQTEMLLKQMGDPEQMGYGAKIAFIAIPKKAKAGTNWQDSTSADGVTRVTNYVIKEINGNDAVVGISGTENRDTKMEMQGMEIGTKTTGTFTGEQTVDVTTGVISKNNLTADAKGTISVMGQDIPTTVKATSVTTVKLM
jgi:hypothetical protein